jgi:endonuclease III
MPGRIATKDMPAHAREVLARLAHEYPDATCTLRHRNPLELLVATILSAQCTDVRVNEVTQMLFEKYPDSQSFADASQDELESDVRPTGFFRNKAKSIRSACRVVADEYGGEVPSTMDALTGLAGVGRKTANVVLGNAFGIDEGVVVDTHVSRLAKRMGLTRQDDPVKIEIDLVKVVPRGERTMVAHQLIRHGREVCTSRKPKCGNCVMSDICPSSSTAST